MVEGLDVTEEFACMCLAYIEHLQTHTRHLQRVCIHLCVAHMCMRACVHVVVRACMRECGHGGGLVWVSVLTRCIRHVI